MRVCEECSLKVLETDEDYDEWGAFVNADSSMGYDSGFDYEAQICHCLNDLCIHDQDIQEFCPGCEEDQIVGEILLTIDWIEI